MFKCLRNALRRVTQKCVNALYRKCKEGREKLIVSFLPVQRQNYGHNCGLFAIAFAAEILDGASPIDAVSDVKEMRQHLICCLENLKLTQFPQAS